MGFCCVCCEVLYLSLYTLGWQSRASSSVEASTEKHRERQKMFFWALAAGSLPGFVIKQFVNFAQVRAAVSALVLLDLERDRRQSKSKREA